jgi:hypothetical protein
MRVKIETAIPVPVAHNHEYPKGANFCPVCGQSVTADAVLTRYKCSNCHHQVQLIDAYCWQCGEALTESGKTEYFNHLKIESADFQALKSKIEGKK